MADFLLVYSIVCFSVGLILSAFITYRDYRGLRRVQHNVLFAWQATLVVFDLIQDASLLCCIIVTGYMMSTRWLSWSEALILSTALLILATNISRLLQPLGVCFSVKLSVYGILVTSLATYMGIYIKYSKNRPGISIIYEFVLLVIAAVSSVGLGILSWGASCRHRSSGGSLNPRVLRLYGAFMIYSLVATVGMAYGAATVFRKSRREKSSDHPRFTAFTGCVGAQVFGIFCLFLTAVERWFNCSTSGSDSTIELRGDEASVVDAFEQQGESASELDPEPQSA